MPPRPWPAVLADAAAVCGATAIDSNHERFVVAQLAACEHVLGTSSGSLVDRIRTVANSTETPMTTATQITHDGGVSTSAAAPAAAAARGTAPAPAAASGTMSKAVIDLLAGGRQC